MITPIDAVFSGYTGKRRWMVIHERMTPNTVYVAAPNESAAIVAAADAWHTKWTAIDFYAYLLFRVEPPALFSGRINELKKAASTYLIYGRYSVR